MNATLPYFPADTAELSAVGGFLSVDVRNANTVVLVAKGGAVAPAGVALVFEASPDDALDHVNGQWVSVTAGRSNANASETGVSAFGLAAGAVNPFSWEIATSGYQWFRARLTAITSGSIILTARRSIEALEPTPVIPTHAVTMGGTWFLDAAPRTIITGANLTATNLGAGATYTGTTIDGGATASAWATRVRPVVRHLTATPVHGYLVLEESPDNFTTTIETRRVAVPADGQFRSFDWPLHYRYWRLKFINGNQAQTGMRLDFASFRGEGSSVDEDKVLQYLLSNTALAASATFTSQTFDLGPNAARNLVRAFAQANGGASIANGFRIEWSQDGSTWWWSGDATTQATAQTPRVMESKAVARYFRVVYVNDTTAQTAFQLWATIVSL